ncbi:unnamed protein product [Aphanomyces euteiches]
MKFTALLASSLVVLSALAEEYDWQSLAGGNAIAGRKSLASFSNTEVLQNCRTKCEGVDGTVGISISSRVNTWPKSTIPSGAKRSI